MRKAEYLGVALALTLIVSMAGLFGCQPRSDTLPSTPPPQPDDLSASQGTYADLVIISWAEVPGTVRYELERSTSADGPFTPLSHRTGSLHEDAHIVPGGLYWYRIRACASECSSWSQAVSGFASAPLDQPWTPQMLSATQGTHDDRVVITWLGVPGAGHYRLFRAGQIEGPYEEIATPLGNQYEDTNTQENPLALCHGYWYRIAACAGSLCGETSEAQEGWRGTRLASGASVTGLEASDLLHPDRIHLEWSPVPGAIFYIVYRDNTDTVLGTTTEARYDDLHDDMDNPLEANRHYTYWVRACGAEACGCTPVSRPAYGRASSLPGAPTELSFTRESAGIRLSWKPGASIDEATHYLVERAAAEGPFALLAELPHHTLSYEDTDLSPGDTYHYRVSGRNPSGPGDPSAVVSVSYP